MATTRLSAIQPQRLASRHDGFSLLEILIALSIVLMLAALSLPLAVSSLAERAFESAGDSLQEQLLLARAHAQQTGQSVQVVYEPARGDVTVSLFNLESLIAGKKALRMKDAGAGLKWPGSDPLRDGEILFDLDAGGDVEEKSQENRIVEPWAIRTLGSEIWLQQKSPSASEPDSRSSSLEVDGEAAGAIRETSPLLVAVYLPDGTPLVADPLWLVDEVGHTATLTINAWSGDPVIARMQDHQPVRASDVEETRELEGREADDARATSSSFPSSVPDSSGDNTAVSPLNDGRRQ